MIDDDMNNLNKILNDTKKQIQIIQDDCKHIKTELALVPDGTFKAIKRCVVCGAKVGYPTTIELDKFLK
jgi:hypothetical protein